MLAYLMNDGPGISQDQLRLCVFIPSVVIALSWVLIRLKKLLVVPALIVAVLGALIVCMEALHPLTRGSMVEEFGTSYVVAIFLSAAFPFLAIVVFYLEAKRMTNQIRINAGKGPAASAASAARRG